MKKETVEKQAKENNIKTKVIAIGGVIGTVVLGGLYYKLYRDNRNLKLGMIALENEIGLDNEENEIGLDNVMTNEDNEIYYDNFMEKANDIMARIKDQLAK